MLISVDAEKAFDKIQYAFMITLNKLEKEGNLLNLIMLSEKSTANIILGSEKVDPPKTWNEA